MYDIGRRMEEARTRRGEKLILIVLSAIRFKMCDLGSGHHTEAVMGCGGVPRQKRETTGDIQTLGVHCVQRQRASVFTLRMVFSAPWRLHHRISPGLTPASFAVHFRREPWPSRSAYCCAMQIPPTALESLLEQFPITPNSRLATTTAVVTNDAFR